MSDVEPNERQRELIETTDGILLVDAGPGTGKTFAITRRYANIVTQSSVDPADVLLVTFTRNAATEMKERIVQRSSYRMHELADAPIQTFHSLCHDILQEHGYAAPRHLGIDDSIVGTTRVIEDELTEQSLFGEFIGRFRDDHPEYSDKFRALSNPVDLLAVINKLAAKGVTPTRTGWYRDSEDHLDGDYSAFKAQFDALNEPRNDGRKQSKLRSKLNRYGNDKTYLTDAPSRTTLRGSGTKQVPERVARDVFDEDREDLKSFIHDVYFEYLEFALRRNYLNFGFLQTFAYVLLCENDHLRDSMSFQYVMIDEFQDSSEIQFKLALLLSGADNLCVVGDWKQSIYSFQYAAVENILDFESRLDRFATSLNNDRQRVSLDTSEVERIELDENYRSTESIIRFSEEALSTPATLNEDVDEQVLGDIVELSSNAEFDNSNIEAVTHEDEFEAVLAKVQDIVGNGAYAVEDDGGGSRPPEYGDIAVLTRTRDFGRELLSVANEYDFPLSYEGGIELFRTDPAKMLLAWLRILEFDADRGWAVVLEQAGYSLDEIDHILNEGTYPLEMGAFRGQLAQLDSVGSVARNVFTKYGMSGEYADVILDKIQSLHDTTTLTRGELISYIERGIERGSTHEVHTSAGDDSVTVQTIHSVKGLEYPIVILANMNEGKFPPRTRNSRTIQYRDPVGIRERKIYAEEADHPHIYDAWQYDVYRHCLPTDYDEERRLLYVAISRAENHICFVCGDSPNSFIQELPVDLTEGDTAVSTPELKEHTQSQLPFGVSPPEGPIGHTPHSLMQEDVFSEVEELESGEGRGADFGTQVHDFAEAYALGQDVEASNPDEDRVKTFIDSLDGELFVEESAVLPLSVDGERVVISGLVDLVNITESGVDIFDYKTDVTRRAHEEYRKQVSVYYHVLRAEYPEREVTANIFYTADGDIVEIDPLSIPELETLVNENL